MAENFFVWEGDHYNSVVQIARSLVRDLIAHVCRKSVYDAVYQLLILLD